MTTMRQIAREAELSVATICRAMHEPEKLSPDTLERVLIAKKKLDLEASLVITCTFNYTNTFEMIARRAEVLHIHGTIEKKIIFRYKFR